MIKTYFSCSQHHSVIKPFLILFFPSLDAGKLRVLEGPRQGHVRKGDSVPREDDRQAVRDQDPQKGGDRAKGRGGAHDGREPRPQAHQPSLPDCEF